MNKEDFVKLPKGTKVRITDNTLKMENPAGELFQSNIHCGIVIFDKRKDYGNSWTIKDNHLKFYNLDPKFLGRYAWGVEADSVEVLNEPYSVEKTEGNISEISTWKKFMYGRQIKMEEESKPPRSQRGLEFL